MDSTTVILDSLHNAEMLIDTSFNVRALLTETITNSTNNQFLQGGLMLGMLAWLAMQLKGIPIMIWMRIDRLIRFTVYFDETNDFYNAFNRWYSEKHPNKFRNVIAKLRPEDVKDSEHYYSGYDYKRFKLIISQYTDFNTFRYNGRLLFISKDRKEFGSAANKDNAYLDSYSVYGFFARKALRALMEEIRVYREHMYINNDKLEIFYNGHGSDWEEREFTTYKTFDKIFSNCKHILLSDIEMFKKNRDIYKRIGLPFKRGYLFHGPPGNGKTSMIVAMAEYLKMDLYIVNLSGVPDDTSFIRLMNDVPSNCIILFEDIDTFVLDRFGEKDKSPVSFSTLLNALNGVYEPNDAIIAITTNNIEALDPALVRSGRIDQRIHVQNPTWREIIDFMQFFFQTDYEPVISEYDIPLDVSMADVQGICITNINGTMYNAVMALHGLEVQKRIEKSNGQDNQGNRAITTKVESIA